MLLINAHYPLYLANYLFGAVIGDQVKFNYPIDTTRPLSKFGSTRISKKYLKLDKELEYANKRSPLGIILNNSVELSISMDSTKIIPYNIYKAGTLFLLPRELDEPNKSYHPSGLLWMYSEARSICSLTSLADVKIFYNLRYKLGLDSPTLKDLVKHFELFKDISYYYSSKSHAHWCSGLPFFY